MRLLAGSVAGAVRARNAAMVLAVLLLRFTCPTSASVPVFTDQRSTPQLPLEALTVALSASCSSGSGGRCPACTAMPPIARLTSPAPIPINQCRVRMEILLGAICGSATKHAGFSTGMLQFPCRFHMFKDELNSVELKKKICKKPKLNSRKSPVADSSCRPVDQSDRDTGCQPFGEIGDTRLPGEPPADVEDHVVVEHVGTQDEEADHHAETQALHQPRPPGRQMRIEQRQHLGGHEDRQQGERHGP